MVPRVQRHTFQIIFYNIHSNNVICDLTPNFTPCTCKYKILKLMLIICRRNSDRQYRHNNVRKRGTITKSSISVFLVVSKRNAMFLHPISKECLESSIKQATRLNSPQWNRLSLLVQPFSFVNRTSCTLQKYTHIHQTRNNYWSH